MDSVSLIDELYTTELRIHQIEPWRVIKHILQQVSGSVDVSFLSICELSVRIDIFILFYIIHIYNFTAMYLNNIRDAVGLLYTVTTICTCTGIRSII